MIEITSDYAILFFIHRFKSFKMNLIFFAVFASVAVQILQNRSIYLRELSTKKGLLNQSKPSSLLTKSTLYLFGSPFVARPVGDAYCSAICTACRPKGSAFRFPSSHHSAAKQFTGLFCFTPRAFPRFDSFLITSSKKTADAVSF